jgi:hypothetical protein
MNHRKAEQSNACYILAWIKIIAIDAFPAYWATGKGKLDKPEVIMKTNVRVLE